MRMYCDRHQKVLPDGKCDQCQLRNIGYGIFLIGFVVVPALLVTAALIKEAL